MEIKVGTMWKFKEGKGDRYRRLRILEVGVLQVKVRSFYTDELPVYMMNKTQQSDLRRQPENIKLLRRSLQNRYVCISTDWREDPQAFASNTDIAVLKEFLT